MCAHVCMQSKHIYISLDTTIHSNQLNRNIFQHWASAELHAHIVRYKYLPKASCQLSIALCFLPIHSLPKYGRERLHKSYPKAAQRLPKGCPKAAQRLPKGCPKAAQRLPKGCPKAAQRLPKGCPKVPRTINVFAQTWKTTVPQTRNW